MNSPVIKEDILTKVNSTLAEFFEQSINDAEKIDPAYQRLWKHLYSLIQSGGKRHRPKMTLMAYTAFGGTELEAAAPIAAAQELLHFSLLIHDDVIDRDYTRYGVANIAGRYKNIYAEYVSSNEDLIHYSHSAAILAGDLMLSGAHRLIASSQLNDEAKTTAQHLLSIGIFEVAGGELLDTELSFLPYKTGDALNVALYKTASYSFVAPLLTGASLAGANAYQRTALRDYATSLGIAYQLTDDLLGVFGDEEKTGKSTVSDIVEGKRTYMVEQAFEALSESDQAIFMRAFGNTEASPEDISVAKQLLVTSGARLKTEEKVSYYTDMARRSLEALSLPAEQTQPLEELITKVTDRSS